ncbi:hypothetical protein AEA09_10950 [Lysinibacillus contaminans]|uniref:Uncharacterized protein n=2 Tax=Lysinibacillus contaminans TaxID=1293441 RepID=A0ABR5K4Z9_9BACI|nr:hypothetical protein AEA09_10950 [Lysinibacillus contaminans]
MEYEKKQRQLKLLKWLTFALFLKLFYLDVFQGANFVQHLLMYVAFIKSLSYYDGVTHAKIYIRIGFGVLLVNLLSDGLFSHYWLLIMTAAIDILIIFEFLKILQIIEEEQKTIGPTARIMKKYLWSALVVMISWTFLMNLKYDTQVLLLFIGAVLLFGINARLLLHLRLLKKDIKSTMHFVTYS